MKFQKQIILQALASLMASNVWTTSFTLSSSSVKSMMSFRGISPMFQTSESGEDLDGTMDKLDWRTFRAQLVLNEHDMDLQDFHDHDGDIDGIGSIYNELQTIKGSNKQSRSVVQGQSWGYDPGTAIETGSIILGGVEQDFGFGLNQQFFHKSVMLVINHADTKFTKAVILNRPTDLCLVDEDGNEWNVWYGGCSNDINHPKSEINCLHILSNPSNPSNHPLLNDASTPIMDDLQYCTLEQAQRLVREGLAKPSDFWTFAGFSAWGSGQLNSEIENKSWYMCTTDTHTIVRELSKQKEQLSPSMPLSMSPMTLADKRPSPMNDAGINFWIKLMKLTSRGETAEECSGDFEDLILKEWTNEHLLSNDGGGNAGLQQRRMSKSPPMYTNGGDTSRTLSPSPAPGVVTKAHDIGIGSLVRASSSHRSPFLLKEQIFHKAIVLMLHEDEDTSIGIILNQPSTQEVELELINRQNGQPELIKMPIRFGGLHAQDENSLMWFHQDIFLAEAKIGLPLGDSEDPIYKCTQEEAIAAIHAGLAEPSSFLVVNGLSVWLKDSNQQPACAPLNGMKGQVEQGRFEAIDTKRVHKLFTPLTKQRTLNWMNLGHNLKCGDDAWRKASGVKSSSISHHYSDESHRERRRLAKLSDDALKSWVATFLLGSPTLGA